MVCCVAAGVGGRESGKGGVAARVCESAIEEVKSRILGDFVTGTWIQRAMET